MLTLVQGSENARDEKTHHPNQSLDGVDAVCFGEGLSGLWPGYRTCAYSSTSLRTQTCEICIEGWVVGPKREEKDDKGEAEGDGGQQSSPFGP